MHTCDPSTVTGGDSRFVGVCWHQGSSMFDERSYLKVIRQTVREKTSVYHVHMRPHIHAYIPHTYIHHIQGKRDAHSGVSEAK